jgi:hypothetical protein
MRVQVKSTCHVAGPFCFCPLASASGQGARQNQPAKSTRLYFFCFLFTKFNTTLKAAATHSSSPNTKLHATVAPPPPLLLPSPPAAALGNQNVSCGHRNWPVVVAWNAPPQAAALMNPVLILLSILHQAMLATSKKVLACGLAS